MFEDLYPKLDLHGTTRDLVFSLVNEFINDNIKLNNKNIVIVHGIGEGIVKKELYDNFFKDKRVISLKVMINNPGSSIIKLNLKE